MKGTLSFLPSILLAAALCGCPGGSPQGDPPVGPDRNGLALVERAIEALGGRERLETIAGIHTVSHSVGRGVRHEIEATTMLPDRCRLQIDTGYARIVNGRNGEETWSTLDGLPTEVNRDDRRAVSQHLAQVEMALLAGLRTRRGCRLEDEGCEDGLRWLEARFAEEDLGPYRLAFDPESYLLRRLEWREDTGHGRTEVSLELSDYREVDGVMTAYRGVFREGDEIIARNLVKSVRFLGSGEIAQPAFEGPTEKASADPEPITPAIRDRIVRHDSPSLDTYWLEAEDCEVKGLGSRLREWISDLEIASNAPPIQLLDADSGAPLGLAIPVEMPPAPPAPRGRDDPVYRRLEACSYLSVALRVPEGEKDRRLPAVLAILQERASPPASGDEALPRTIRWPGGIVQVQVPTRSR